MAAIGAAMQESAGAIGLDDVSTRGHTQSSR